MSKNERFHTRGSSPYRAIPSRQTELLQNPIKLLPARRLVWLAKILAIDKDFTPRVACRRISQLVMTGTHRTLADVVF